MYQSVSLPEIIKKLVSQTTSFTCIWNKTSDIYCLYWYKPCATGTFRVMRCTRYFEFFTRARFSYIHHTMVSINCCKWIICNFSMSISCSIKKSGFTNIRFSNYAYLHTHNFFTPACFLLHQQYLHLFQNV